MTWRAPALLHLDIRRFDDRTPALGFRFLKHAQRFRRLLLQRCDLDAEFLKALLDRWRGQHLYHGGVEFRDDLLRRVLRHPEPIPERHEEAGQARLVSGWNVWQGFQPRL